MFLLLTAFFPIPRPGVALEIRDLICPTSVGPRSPGMGACSRSCYSRREDPGYQRASHSPIPSFPSPVWISHPLEQLSTFAGEGQALGVTLWSVQQPQEISHPERSPQPQSSRALHHGVTRVDAGAAFCPE